MCRSSLLYKKFVLFCLLFRELCSYIWSKLRYKGRLKAEEERNVTGAVVIVTGANSGIGKAAAYEFAIRGAHVIMACRNLTEGNKAIVEHRKRATEEGIKFTLDLKLLHLDLMDFSSVRTFCSEVKATYAKVDILVNNAGIFDTSGVLKRTKIGVEEHILVNYLSQFLLTQLLMDVLKPTYQNSTPSRIIDVSSSLQWFGMMADENNLMLEEAPVTTGICNALPYGMSKFYISLFSKEMSRRVDEKQALFYSMCPGYVDTGMFRSFSWCLKLSADIVIALVGVSPSAGCDTILYLALSKVPPPNGLFFRFDRLHSRIERNLEQNQKFGTLLWNRSATLVGLGHEQIPSPRH